MIADHTAGTGTLALTTVDAGVIVLTGSNTYSGATTVSGGTLALSGANGTALNSSSWTINNGGAC